MTPQLVPAPLVRWLLPEVHLVAAGSTVTVRRWRSAAALTVAAALTLLVVAQTGGRLGWEVVGLAMVGLLVPWLTRRWWFWVATAATMLNGGLRWSVLSWDNHHWLELYWVLAWAVAMLAWRPRQVLASSARRLVGLTFLLAAGWKLTPEFVTGRFFEAMFVADGRLAPLVEAAGWQEPSTHEQFQDARNTHAPSRRPQPIDVPVSDQVRLAAQVVSAGAILLEGAVAAAFLLPWRRLQRRFQGRSSWAAQLVSRSHLAGDVVLPTFILVTYPLAPVSSFGHLLCAMGAAASHLPVRGRLLVYGGCFAAVSWVGDRQWLFDLVERTLT